MSNHTSPKPTETWLRLLMVKQQAGCKLWLQAHFRVRRGMRSAPDHVVSNTKCLPLTSSGLCPFLLTSTFLNHLQGYPIFVEGLSAQTWCFQARWQGFGGSRCSSLAVFHCEPLCLLQGVLPNCPRSSLGPPFLFYSILC